QPGKTGCLFRGNPPLGSYREMNPAMAFGTAPCKPGVVPPGAYERVVNGRSIAFHPKIDGLHVLPTTRVGTNRISVNNVRCHGALAASFTVQGVHALLFTRGGTCRFSRGLSHHAVP